MQVFIRQRLKSFGYAIRGIGQMMRSEVHAWIHLLAALIVIVLAVFLELSPIEWGLLIICIILVFAAEAFNTAIELLTDLVSPDFHPLAGKVKDIAAGAVLICAIGAAVVGSIILGPPLWLILTSN